MEIKELITITCPCCNKKYDKEVITVAEINEKLKQDIISSDLFTSRCPYCDVVTLAPYDFDVYDFDNHVMLRFTTGNLKQEEKNFRQIENKLNESIMFNQVLSSDFQYRVVDNVFTLAEKVMIFQEGYDDRIIEICKAIIREAVKELGTSCDNIQFDYDERINNYVFLIEYNGRVIETTEFKQDMYNNLYKSFKEIIEDFNRHDLLVDYSWAKKHIDEK